MRAFIWALILITASFVPTGSMGDDRSDFIGDTWTIQGSEYQGEITFKKRIALLRRNGQSIPFIVRWTVSPPNQINVTFNGEVFSMVVDDDVSNIFHKGAVVGTGQRR